MERSINKLSSSSSSSHLACPRLAATELAHYEAKFPKHILQILVVMLGTFSVWGVSNIDHEDSSPCCCWPVNLQVDPSRSKIYKHLITRYSVFAVWHCKNIGYHDEFKTDDCRQFSMKMTMECEYHHFQLQPFCNKNYTQQEESFHWKLNFAIPLMTNLLNLNSAYHYIIRNLSMIACIIEIQKIKLC